MGKGLAECGKGVAVFKRQGSDYESFYPCIKVGLGNGCIAYASAKLDVYIVCGTQGAKRLDQIKIFGLSAKGAVQIHYMDPAGAFFYPMFCHGYRISRK